MTVTHLPHRGRVPGATSRLTDRPLLLHGDEQRTVFAVESERAVPRDRPILAG